MKNRNKAAEEKSGRGIFVSDETIKKLTYGAMLLALFVFSLYVRAVLPYNSEVFPEYNSYKFAADDAVLQVRFVELAVKYFPNRPMFEPFTLFPQGSPVHFGPLFSQMIAFFSLILSFGSPDRFTIHTVAVFFPAVIGALVVFPVYSIAKEVFDRRAGIMAAVVVASMPGQFLSRSLMGFTDHHVAEVFFMTTTIALYIIALKKSRGVTFGNFLRREWKIIKTPIIYSVLAGISYGMYMQSWMGASLLLVVLLPFAAIQYTFEHLRGRSTDYIAITSMITLGVSFLMIIPYADPSFGIAAGRYSLYLPFTVLFAISFVVFLTLLSILMKRKNIPNFFFPFALLAIGIIGWGLLGVLFPTLQSAIFHGFYIFSPSTGGLATVAEAGALRPELLGAYFNVWPFYFSMFSLVVIAGYKILYRDFIKNDERNPGATLVFIWSLVMLLATLGQNRFAYYSAVTIGICVGYFVVQTLDWVGAKELFKSYREKVKDFDDLKRFFSSKTIPILLVTFMLVVLFFASVNGSNVIGEPGNLDRTWWQSYGGSGGGGDYMEWFYALDWMRYNTPDPQDDKVLNFTKFYVRPESGPFPYPKKSNGTTWYDYEKAYGVMSWWDYGHVITYFGHRIPNANPFQAGIGVLACPERDPYLCTYGKAEEVGSKNLTPGAAPFFVETSEEKANVILDALGTRYIMTDWQMATGKFYAMATWAQGGNMSYVNERYYQIVRTESGPQQNPSNYYYFTMEAKLHFFDGSSFENAIPALKHYRLIYESPGSVGTVAGREMKFIKTYEYLRGANITGKAPPLSSVSLFLPLKTNQGRNFNYTQTTASNEDGTYTFTVPYSNEVPQDNWPSLGKTNFAVLPTMPYIIAAGNVTKTLTLTEDQVLYGGNVTLNLLE